MAEPFGTGAGIVGVIGLTIQITQAITQFGVDWKDAPDVIKAFMAELGTLKTVLSETNTNVLLNPEFAAAFENRHSSLLYQVGPHVRNTDTKVMLTICREKLESLLGELRKRGEGHRIGWERLKGAFLAKDTRDSVENLSRQCQNLNNMLSIDTAILAATIHKEIGETRKEQQQWHQTNSKTFSAIQSSTDQSRLWLYNKEHQAILDWLTLIDYAPQQHDFISRRQLGTGQWLLNTAEYQDWQRIDKKTLFCPGIPGAGKTILTAIVIDDLMTRFANNATVCVAYIFCNFRRVDEQKIEDLLINLLKQLTQSLGSLPDNVKSLYDSHTKKRSRPSKGEISRTLKHVAAMYSKVFIIVDALDECQKSNGCRAELLSEIFELQAISQTSIFATSRLIPEIQEIFEKSMHLEIKASEQDIKRYLNSQLLLLPKFVQQNPELENEITNGIIEAADGMFLLAQLHLNSLKGKRSPKAIRIALQKLPFGSEAYDFAYEEAMQRIEGQLPDEDELAKQVLSWIICAKRPLTTAELQHALAVEAGDSRFDIENLSQVEDMVAVCAGLVTVDEESRIIRLVHYTTQQYFERTQQKWFPNAEADITRICVTYLSFDLFKIGFCHTDAQFEERLQVHKLYEYAAKNWGHHARLASVPYHEVADFLECESKLEASTQALIAEKRSQGNSNYSQRFPQKMRGLHIAAYFGIREVAYALVDKGHLDIRDSYGQTPLLLAAGRGHATVVNMLVENQADVNAQGGHYSNALVAASDNGHEAIVRLLLEHQADVNAQKGYYGNALIAASAGGHEAIVRLLLEHQADVNAQGGFYGNALQAASAKGHEAIVRQLLLEHQADVNAQGGYYGNALIAASDNGHEAIVKRLLLEHQADVNVQGGYYGNALQAASAKGHETIIRQLLLEHQADVNAQGGYYGNALIAASAKGHEAIVRLLLLEHQADVNAQGGGRYGNALVAAAAKGHEAIVRLLLEHQADVNTQGGGRYGNALVAASAKGHEAIVRLLLEHQADVNAQGGRYGNALVAASANGWETVAKQLIATAGVDVNLKDAIGRVPLAYAAMRGHRVVVTTLLNNECVDADHRDYYGATPLSLAARHCHTAVVKLLLATRRVDINSQDLFGHTPLWWARNTECAEILLKYAELNDITVCRSDIHTEVGSLPNDGTVIWCDVCTLNIQDGDVYYCCGVCSGGDFDICSVCYTIGGRCLEPRHELLEQK